MSIEKVNDLDKFFKDIYKEDNELVQLWCEKINNAMDYSIYQNNKGRKKELVKTHRDILVRWLAQIDDKGSDSYSTFKSIKKNAERLDDAPKNWLISENAKNLIETAQNKGDVKSVPNIVFEHNPPVKVICDLLDEKWVSPFKSIDQNIINQIKKIAPDIPLNKMVNPIYSQEIFNICNEQKYCVMIISKDEHQKIINKKYKQKGSFEVRIEAAEIESFYQKTV